MSNDSEHSKKLDTIDLIITVLKEHEKSLDSLSHKLESLIDKFSTREPLTISSSLHRISLNKWHEFKQRGKGAEAIAFEIKDNTFSIYAKVRGDVFNYSEKIPQNSYKIIDEDGKKIIDKIYVEDVDTIPFFNGILRCGFRFSIKTSTINLTAKETLLNLNYEFEASRVKEFLSKELSVSESNIVEGNITA